MLIKHKRIRNIENYMIDINEGESFFIGTNDSQDIAAKLKRIGFSSDLNTGEAVLPKIVGPISRFNAEGGHEKLYHLPKETYYIMRLLEWEDWNGTQYSRIIIIPRERYQRKLIAPPSEEIILNNDADMAVGLSGKLIYTKDNYGVIKHIINLYLELFGECIILKEDLTPMIKAEVKRLNWEVLPPGDYPWEKVRERVEAVCAGKSSSKRSVLLDRVGTITNHGGKLIATGAAGFNGYMIFSTPHHNVFLLESLLYGNATYVLNENWENFSKMSKAEIINSGLHQDRIIHKDDWMENIGKLLKTK